MHRNRSSSPFGLLASPTIQLSLFEDIHFLRPANEGPTYDPHVSGSVKIYLPKARKLKHLTVKLTGKQEIGFPDGVRAYEATTILEKELSLVPDDQDSLHLERGEHTFAFTMTVPSNTPSYERCQYGKTRFYFTAKAKGLSALGGDLLSAEKPIYLICNPGGAGEPEPPPPLSLKYEAFSNDLGPYTLSLSSGFTMVGGLLMFRLALILPPTGLVIHSIRVKVNQKFHLTSAYEPGFECDAPNDPRTVFVLDGRTPPNFGTIPPPEGTLTAARSGSPPPGAQSSPLATLQAGQEWRIHHLSRFPNDSLLRPTTQPGPQAGIKVSHSVSMECVYRVIQDGEEDPGMDRQKLLERMKQCRKLVVAKPVSLFSCCCFVDSLALPPYALDDPHLETTREAPPCLCLMPMAELVQRHGKQLCREEDEQGTTYMDVQKEEDRRRRENEIRSREASLSRR